VGASCSQQFLFIDNALSFLGGAFAETTYYTWLSAHLSPPQWYDKNKFSIGANLTIYFSKQHLKNKLRELRREPD
jgi:hypothetical protein